MNTVEVLEKQGQQMIVKFDNGYTFQVSQEEFDSVFENISGNTFKMRADIDTMTDKAIQELQEMLPLAIAARDGDGSDQPGDAIDAFHEVAYDFCKRYNVTEQTLQTSLKILELTLLKKPVNLEAPKSTCSIGDMIKLKNLEN
jgi:hypothetical protein